MINSIQCYSLQLQLRCDPSAEDLSLLAFAAAGNGLPGFQSSVFRRPCQIWLHEEATVAILPVVQVKTDGLCGDDEVHDEQGPHYADEDLRWNLNLHTRCLCAISEMSAGHFRSHHALTWLLT